MLSRSLSHPNLHLGIFGDLVQGALGGFGEKPKVPSAPVLDLQGAQTRSTQGNIAALPGLEGLASSVDQFNLGERKKSLESAIPGYSGLIGGESNLLSNWLSGTLSPDVASNVARASNARAFAGGYGGSGMADNLTARDLGLTSLDLQRAGASALPGYLSSLYNIGVPQQFNVQSGFVSPAQQLSVDQINANEAYQNQWLRNQLAAIPDPETAAVAKDVGGIADLAGTAALGWAGGGLGAFAGGAGGGSLGSFLGGSVGGGSPSSGNLFSGLFGGGNIGGGMTDSFLF